MREPCCQDPDNLKPQETGREDEDVLVCQVCGRKHTRLTVDSGKYTITGQDAGLAITRVAETWQFFAFVFAAAVAFLLALIDEVPTGEVPIAWGRVLLKVGAFFLVGYLTLINRWFRNILARLLTKFKTERF